MSDKLRTRIYQRRKMLFCALVVLLVFLLLAGRLVALMIFQGEYYTEQAQDVQQRERAIKAARGEIYDTNGELLAGNRTVCTVSVVYSQISDPEEVIRVLTEVLELEESAVRKKVEKRSSREVISTNVDIERGDTIRSYALEGVKVDEDYKRYYPYGSLASKVLGFTGGDNQGIIGLETIYEEQLKGTGGIILTPADAHGVELDGKSEERIEPIAGSNLYLTLDINIQKFAQQKAQTLLEEKAANSVSVIAMNPQNGAILAMVNVPEFDLNDPFTLGVDTSGYSQEQLSELRNQMWRNGCINDTYEPGSTFKIITMAAGLTEGVVSESDSFFCPGYKIVEDRRIRCHKTSGHGSEDFVQGAMNSCNPVFMEVGMRIGPERYYEYFEQFKLLKKTGIDLPGEAGTIMHKKEDIKEVELATISFGQSFQVTPLRLLTTVCSIINGGREITPHLGNRVESSDGSSVEILSWQEGDQVVSEDVSDRVCAILEQVVSGGSGSNARVEDYSVGGKTATSEKLPRSENKYISSFLGFAPTTDPQVAILITVDEPQGVYYGGSVCAPAAAEIFDNILPYLEVEQSQKSSGND